MRLRSTALPICRVTVKPNRGPSADRVLPSRALASRTKAAVAHRLPLRTRKYSERLLRVVTREVGPLACVALAMRHPSLPAASSREALATLRAPPCHHPPTACGRHALAETMPALAHEPARLVGPFHVKSPFRLKARAASNPLHQTRLAQARLVQGRRLAPRLAQARLAQGRARVGEIHRWQRSLHCRGMPAIPP
jgi:hypothetical protein